jgi:integrase
MPKLDAKFLDKVKAPAAGRVIYWDDTLKGFGLLVMASGHKSFVFQYRVAKKLRRMKLDAGNIDTARTQAEVLKGKVATGRLLNQPSDPLAERRRAENIDSGKGAFKAVTEEWLKREGKNTRSGAHRFKQIERLVFPVIGSQQISDIKRGDIVRLLDAIKDDNGPGMAAFTLKAIRRVMSWHEGRNDDFVTPIHGGMAKTIAKANRRQRTLRDEELRVVWRAAKEDTGPYGALIRFLLLTAARREEAAQMRRSELVGNDWKIPPERFKTGIEHVVPLSPAAKAIVDKLPKLGKGDLVFTSAGVVPISGFTDRKAAFDAAVLELLREQDPDAEPLPNWTLHDLRRTARTLMGRARILTDIAERCLGHVKGGERETYDCWEYLDEKREAFEKLAALIEIIIAPKADNVTSPDKRRAKGVSQVPG